MKKLLLSVFICVLAAIPLQYSTTQASAPAKVFDSIGLNVMNSPNYYGSLYVYGPTSLSATLNPGTGMGYGPLTPGYYTINVYTSAPGTRTFTLNGNSVTTDAGYATFNVNIIYTAFLTIY
ncbi:hypothetical protein MKQ68_12440 [Chitinophaga horti]|uniref:DUF4397 domain-containing protein n=1 Tax=Chitinophaga horti TaxID=2920382 RepID=A0ABY6JC81_9BACT|nr:hypothetical protein [Chitinophaga horti]UYQ95909.1 hypothetical protein MKQ68_12440 [Chitinophaga horti]